jgi:hypothetical protein
MNDKQFNELSSEEIKSRLERGRKAINTIDTLIKKVNAIMYGEHGIDWADDFGPLFDIITKAEHLINQQPLKEAADEN